MHIMRQPADMAGTSSVSLSGRARCRVDVILFDKLLELCRTGIVPVGQSLPLTPNPVEIEFPRVGHKNALDVFLIADPIGTKWPTSSFGRDMLFDELRHTLLPFRFLLFLTLESCVTHPPGRGQ